MRSKHIRRFTQLAILVVMGSSLSGCVGIGDRTPEATPVSTPPSPPTATRIPSPTVARTATPSRKLPTETTAPTASAGPDANELLSVPEPGGKLSPHYYTYTDLPNMTDSEIRAYCRMSARQWEAYYQEQHAEARGLSDRLEDYIRSWLSGSAEAKLPQGLLPTSIDNEKTKEWTLLRPEEVRPQDQWIMHPALEIPEDFSQLPFRNSDSHASYLKLFFVAPFDSILLVEGDFAHARFMDYQVLGPFDPRNPTTSGLGAPEVPIVDVDIEPDPGHTNPFRANADRNSAKRHYHLTFELKAGNAVDLNPSAMVPPAYRAPGNVRVGGPLGAAGPYGDGQLIPSTLWLRYYAPDKAAGPLGGVPIPKALLRLKTGETFWLQPDFSLAKHVQTMLAPGHYTPPEEPKDLMGPAVGWFKLFGFWLTYADGAAYAWVKPWGPLPKSWAEKLITSRDKCLFGRGPNMPPPGNHEISASGMNYNTYLMRPMSLGKGKVYVLTGRLPITPKTRDGEPLASTGEARYWSLCHNGNGEEAMYPGLQYGCLMDDEVAINSQREFVIAYSRRSDRPSNARTECGVTWQDFGLESRQWFHIRWMSVMPDDHLPGFSPDLSNIPWAAGEWSQPTWDPSLVSYNSQDGVMGPYQPLIRYLTRQEFESLGCPVEPASIPEWK